MADAAVWSLEAASFAAMGVACLQSLLPDATTVVSSAAAGRVMVFRRALLSRRAEAGVGLM